MPIDQDILDRLSGLLGRRDLTQTEMADWFGGAEDGGPNGDGLYPLTDSTGYTRFVPSPAKQMATMGNGLDADGLNQLALAQFSDVGDDFRVIGKAVDGEPKLFTAPMIFNKTIPDLPEITQQISDVVLLGWSRQRQEALGNGTVSLSAGEIAAGITGVLNPKITYGAKGDGRVVYDLVTEGGSNVVFSDDSPFSPLDVGKLFWCTNGYNYGPLASTIIEYIDSKHVRLAHTSNSWRGGQQAIWGTDDTGPLTNWLDALPGQGKFNFGRAGLLPEGIFLARQLGYGSRMAIKGSARGASTLALIPGLDGSAQLYNKHPLVDFPVIQDLTLLGNRYLQSTEKAGLSFQSVLPGSPQDTLPFTDPSPQFARIHIQLPSGSGFVHVNRGSGKFIDFDIDNAGLYGLESQGYDMHYYNFQIAASRFTGLYCGRYGSTGNDFRNFKVFFCGTDPYRRYANGDIDYGVPGEIAWEDGCNVFLGGGQLLSAGRLQESWGPNMVVASAKSICTDIRFDDTGCAYPRHGQYRPQLMTVRPAIMFLGSAAIDNILNNMFVTTAVHPDTNYATQALFFKRDNNGGDPAYNLVEMKVQRTIGDYYPGGSGAYAPQQISTDNPAGYTTNKVVVNFDKVIG